MKRIAAFIDKSVEGLIVISVILIIIFAVANIVLRWFHVSLTWIDPFVRHLVFLSAFLGAILATASNRHIKVDLLQKILGRNGLIDKVVRVLYFSITLIVLAALAYSGVSFVQTEFEYGKEVFLNLHSGFLTSIIPFGFIVMTIRHALTIFDDGVIE